MIGPFVGPYAFLSNFWPCDVIVDDTIWSSAEHAYQAAKTLVVAEKEEIRVARVASAAKRLGKRVTLRLDWETNKVSVMLVVLQAKFSIGSRLARLLVDTGDEQLVEINHWYDTFWGVCKGKGENHLGRLLMQVRQMRIVTRHIAFDPPPEEIPDYLKVWDKKMRDKVDMCASCGHHDCVSCPAFDNKGDSHDTDSEPV